MNYSATFTPTGNGSCTIDVNAGAFTDDAGNNNAAADQFNWTYTSSASAPTFNLSFDYSTVYQTVDGLEVD